MTNKNYLIALLLTCSMYGCCVHGASNALSTAKSVLVVAQSFEREAMDTVTIMCSWQSKECIIASNRLDIARSRLYRAGFLVRQAELLVNVCSAEQNIMQVLTVDEVLEKCELLRTEISRSQ